MYLLGLDIGTSSIKASIVEAECKSELAAISYPESEVLISSPKPNWAEQDPENWWENCQVAIKKVIKKANIDGKLIDAIGISYQMHGLVMVDKNQNVLRPSIIWCDSRAIDQGNKALETLGQSYCTNNLLNAPGNFTASKLAWVKENEPEIFEKCYKFMLPGDFVSMKLTGEITITNSGLSEGIFWDFKNNCISQQVLDVFGIDISLVPEIKNVFDNHGKIKANVAADLGLNPNAKVCYKAGDQPNNAMSLNVLNPGELAATAGTSGVIYGVTDKVKCDRMSRINGFGHVNHGSDIRIGNLVCINGAGILNRWVKDQFGQGKSYSEINDFAANIPLGSDNLAVYPFGNGAERILENKIFGGQLLNVDFNKHSVNHIFRAAQEGIVFAMKYGFDILSEIESDGKIIRAGYTNMFLSKVFADAFVNTINLPLELIETNGAKGAALGAGFGLGYFHDLKEAFSDLRIVETLEPTTSKTNQYQEVYQSWKLKLDQMN